MATSFLPSFLRSWLGDFTKDELKKFLFLAFIFFFTIGIYWFLRTSKDGVFDALVGFDWQPFAKWVSMFFVIPLTMFYGALVDYFPRHKVFYALASIYSIAALIFVYLLSHPTIGLANPIASHWRLLGWAYYLFVESFGSIMVVCFWAFASDTTSPESAKRGYPIMSLFAQFGAWLGSAVNSGRFGDFPVKSTLLYCAGAILLIPLMVYIFMTVIPQEQLRSYSGEKAEAPKSKKPRVGFVEGFKFVFSQPYLLGIFFSIMIYEVVNTLFDFKFKSAIGAEVARFVSENNIPAAEVAGVKAQMFSKWVGLSGEWMAIIGIMALILGIGNISRILGLTVSLIVLPILLSVIAMVLAFSKSLIVALGAVAVTKGLNYALYQTSKEQLYIPTSKDAKYKSKAFIEMFGSRTSKASASLINAVKLYFPFIFPIISLGSSIILCVVWASISFYLGRSYERAVKHNEVVC